MPIRAQTTPTFTQTQQRWLLTSSGQIIRLPIRDNQRVKKGELLFVVDPRPYKLALDTAKTRLNLTEIEVSTLRDTINSAAAQLAERKVEAANARQYLDRIVPLQKKDFVTENDVVEARNKLRAGDAGVLSAASELEKAKDALGILGDVNQRVRAAQEAIEDAQLNYDYCFVRAPFDGYVTNLNISAGQYANTGVPVLTLVDDREWYVLAYFREDLLDRIRPGMPAEVSLLSYPGKRFQGEVQGIGWGLFQQNGATVGGLPNVEETLNWVRLNQRFPVRIVLKRDNRRPSFSYGTNRGRDATRQAVDGAGASATMHSPPNRRAPDSGSTQAVIDSLFEAVDAFFAFLARELAPSPRRVTEAARNAAKSTVTTGLATAMQVLGPFGPLFAYRIGQPGISLGIFEGAVTIAIAAAMQAAIVPITGKILDYPGLIMVFLFVVFAAIAYFSANTRLFMLFALTAVGTISTVYVAIFEPGQIGWGSTYTFDGILVATLVLVLFDTLIWPSPPEPRLLESIAADFDRTRSRLQLVGQRYLDPLADPLPAPRVKSTLAPNLTLLNSVKEYMKPAPSHLAALLDAVMTAEHVYLEVERLAVLADEPVSDAIRQHHRETIQAAIQVLDSALAQRAENVLAGLPGGESSSQLAADLQLTIQHLERFEYADSADQ